MSVFDDIAGAVEGAVDAVGNLVDAAGNAIDTLGSDVEGALGDVARGLQNEFGSVVGDLESLTPDLQTLGEDIIHLNGPKLLNDAGQAFVDLYKSGSAEIVKVVKNEIDQANTLIENATGINFEEDIQNFTHDVGAFIDQHAALIQSICIDAVVAGMTVVGVPAPLAMALGSLAADLIQNHGHLDAATIGQVFGDAVAGPAGGAIAGLITQAAATGKLDLSTLAQAAAIAVQQHGGADAITDTISSSIGNALEGAFGSDIGGAITDTVSQFAVGALNQVATTGTVDMNTLGQAAIGSLKATAGNVLSGATDNVKQWANNQIQAVTGWTPLSDAADLAQAAASAASTIQDAANLGNIGAETNVQDIIKAASGVTQGGQGISAVITNGIETLLNTSLPTGVTYDEINPSAPSGLHANYAVRPSGASLTAVQTTRDPFYLPYDGDVPFDADGLPVGGASVPLLPIYPAAANWQDGLASNFFLTANGVTFTGSPGATYSIAALDADKQANPDVPGTMFTFQVSRTGSVAAAATLNYNIVATGANPVANMQTLIQGGALAGSVTFAAGSSTATIAVPIATINTQTEQFRVTLDSLDQYYSKSTATGTIEANAKDTGANLYSALGQPPTSDPIIDIGGNLEFHRNTLPAVLTPGQQEVATTYDPATNGYGASLAVIGADIANVYLSFINNASALLVGQNEASKYVNDTITHGPAAAGDIPVIANTVGEILGGGGGGSQEATDIAAIVNSDLSGPVPPGFDNLSYYAQQHLFTLQGVTGSIRAFLTDVASGMTPNDAYHNETGKVAPFIGL